MPSSITARSLSRKRTCVATRGASARPAIASTSARRSAPETRTTPMPPRPGGVAIAAIVGETGKLAPLRGVTLGLTRQHPVDVPLLQDLQRVVAEPVEDEARREEQEHD